MKTILAIFILVIHILSCGIEVPKRKPHDRSGNAQPQTDYGTMLFNTQSSNLLSMDSLSGTWQEAKDNTPPESEEEDPNKPIDITRRFKFETKSGHVSVGVRCIFNSGVSLVTGVRAKALYDFNNNTFRILENKSSQVNQMARFCYINLDSTGEIPFKLDASTGSMEAQFLDETIKFTKISDN